MKIYMALDGTDDITDYARAMEAAKIGPSCRVCTIPKSLDPDDLPTEDLNDIKSESKDSLSLWLGCIAKLPHSIRSDPIREVLELINAWNKSTPERAPERRKEFIRYLGFTTEEYERCLVSKTKQTTEPSPHSKESAPDKSDEFQIKYDPNYPSQPLPPGKPLSEDQKPVIANHTFVPVTKADKNGDPSTAYVPQQIPIKDVAQAIQRSMNGYPLRYACAGDKNPLLFFPKGGGQISFIEKSTTLKALCAEYAIRKVRNRGCDKDGIDFADWNDLFYYFGRSFGIPEFIQIEYRPHEPPMKGHFYADTIHPYSNEADGRYLAAALDLFDNIPEPAHKILFIAALVTPFWGGPCGARPAFVFAATAPGHGKGRATELIGAAAGGMLEIESGRRAEETIKERLLSGDSFWKRVYRLDNLKGPLNSQLLESLITAPEISGKAMYKGEGTRPNNLTLLITANDIKVSPDMARRSMFIQMSMPSPNTAWDDIYNNLAGKGKELAADAIHILKQPQPPEPELDGVKESFTLWTREVLARVAMHPFIVQRVGQLSVRDIIKANSDLRLDVDMAVEEARMFERLLINYLLIERGWVLTPTQFSNKYESSSAWDTLKNTDAPIIFTIGEAVALWKENIYSKISASVLGRRLLSHIKAGRLKCIVPYRSSLTRGYKVSRKAINFYIDKLIDGTFTLNSNE